MGLFKRNSTTKTSATQAPEPLLGEDEGFEETKPILPEEEPTDNVSVCVKFSSCLYPTLAR